MKTTEKSKAKNRRSHLKWWIVRYPSGKTRMIKGLKDFCRKHGLFQSCMSRVASGKGKSHRGFSCKRVFNPKIRMVDTGNADLQ